MTMEKVDDINNMMLLLGVVEQTYTIYLAIKDLDDEHTLVCDQKILKI